MDDEYFNPDYVEVDRVLEVSVTNNEDEGEVTHYLVKWRGLPYEDSTWELENDVEQSNIDEFLKWREAPPEEDREHIERPSASSWTPHKESPVYKNDNSLRPYQLEGINWLMYCYHNR